MTQKGIVISFLRHSLHWFGSNKSEIRHDFLSESTLISCFYCHIIGIQIPLTKDSCVGIQIDSAGGSELSELGS